MTIHCLNARFIIMTTENIELKYLPKLEDGLLIAGFDGWGNALEISKGMIDYLIRKLGAEPFGRIIPDDFYSFDTQRPRVDIQDGILKEIEPPGSLLFKVDKNRAGRDMILLNGVEPHLQWFHFIDSILSLCRKAGVKTLISIGGMYDHILHSDTMISVVASSEELLDAFKARKAFTINYKGPSSIHSTLHSEAKKQGFACVGLYCHCPYYLQGTTHFGLLSHVGAFLADWAGFTLDTEELVITWKNISKQIQEEIDKNPELQDMIKHIRKAKVQGMMHEMKKNDNVIQLKDFLDPR